MRLEWGDYLRLYAPVIGYFVLVGAVALLGGIYTAGYTRGCRSILRASEQAVSECAR